TQTHRVYVARGILDHVRAQELLLLATTQDRVGGVAFAMPVDLVESRPSDRGELAETLIERSVDVGEEEELGRNRQPVEVDGFIQDEQPGEVNAGQLSKRDQVVERRAAVHRPQRAQERVFLAGFDRRED